MGKLTTHVLDVYHGRPAADMQIDLWRIHTVEREHVLTVQTNNDGRCDAPLLADDALIIGEYELIFHVRGYFQTQMQTDDASPFLNQVPVRFTVFDAAGHYHVPLLVSPWSYSTYRGS
ncbi:MAG: hydroxyisourate hydrolase [Chloroflexi bacterium AL-W]|nr:hydroxyisourate hydrolase [Chloroflexi bacterium AL-W]